MEQVPAPTIGRIVHYRLSESDCDEIAQRRMRGGWGNPHSVGQVVPLLVCAVWPGEYDGRGVNGQALVDGNFALWITSTGPGDGPGQWSWPPRV